MNARWTTKKIIATYIKADNTQGWSILWMAAHLKVFTPYQPSIVFHIEDHHLLLQSKINYWFLYEMQHWAEMG